MSFSPEVIFNPKSWNHSMPMPPFDAATPSWIVPKGDDEAESRPWPVVLPENPPLPREATSLDAAPPGVPPARESVPDHVPMPVPVEESRFPGQLEAPPDLPLTASNLAAPPIPHVSVVPVDLDAIEMRHAAELEELRTQLRQTMAALDAARREILVATEPEVVRLALAVAERVVGRELTADPELVRGWVTEGLRHMSDEDRLTIMVAPDVAAKLGDEPWTLADGNVVHAKIDASLPAGHCELRGQASRVDASLKARLDAIARELDVEDP